MRRGTLALAVAFMVASGASPAEAAGGFMPALNLANLMLDLDSQAGNFSVLRVSNTADMNALRVTMQMHRLGEDPRWAPGGNVAFKNGQDSVTFQILAPQRVAPLSVRLYRYRDGKQDQEQMFALTVGMDQKLDVAIGWDASGAITVTAGGETHSMNLGEKIEQIELSASTGEVEFNPLSIGRVP